MYGMESKRKEVTPTRSFLKIAEAVEGDDVVCSDLHLGFGS